MDCTNCKSRKIEEDEIKPNGELYKTCKICRENDKKTKLKNICPHNIQKATCKECKGSQICIHNIQKITCKECKGSQICQHNILKQYCKECKGSGICQHNKQKANCKDCKGSQICIHNKQKSRCKDCKGSQICEHNRVKSTCKDCGGSQICEHNIRKTTCKKCGGGGLCIHNRVKSTCKNCNPLGHLVNLQRANINRCLKLSSLNKELHSIEYLGSSAEDFVKYLQKKIDIYNMTNMTDMTFKNIQLDHIKPISKFDLNDKNVLLECCNYTNFQPLFATDNLNKSNKWTDKDEVFWRTNIFNNPDYTDIYMPL